LIFLLITLWLQEATLNPRIQAPAMGSYISGEVTLEFSCNYPDKVVRMEVLRNEEVVHTQDGWSDQLLLEFGPDIRSWNLALVVYDAKGESYRSGTITTRALRVDYEETARLILVPTVVKDRQNRYIQDLKPKHFTVKQDGVPCEIRLIERQKVPLMISLLIDTSSSLKQEQDILKEAVFDFVSQIGGQDRCNLVVFSNEPETVFDFGASSSVIEDRIEDVQPKGATAMFDGLLHSMGLLKELPRSRKTIVLFTDGRDSIYEEVADKRRMLRKVIRQAQDSEIAIFTIGLGERIHDDALEFMASETGGRFLWVKTVGNLKRTFAEVLDDLKNQYVLHVDPVSQDPGFHRLEVEVKKWGARVHARRGFRIESSR